MHPRLGQTVWYRSEIDNGPGGDILSPAMVIRTRDTTVPSVLERWKSFPVTVTSMSEPELTHTSTARPKNFVAELPDDDTVDLVVFGLGKTYRKYCISRGDSRGQWTPSP